MRKLGSKLSIDQIRFIAITCAAMAILVVVGLFISTPEPRALTSAVTQDVLVAQVGAASVASTPTTIFERYGQPLYDGYTQPLSCVVGKHGNGTVGLTASCAQSPYNLRYGVFAVHAEGATEGVLNYLTHTAAPPTSSQACMNQFWSLFLPLLTRQSAYTVSGVFGCDKTPVFSSLGESSLYLNPGDKIVLHWSALPYQELMSSSCGGSVGGFGYSYCYNSNSWYSKVSYFDPVAGTNFTASAHKGSITLSPSVTTDYRVTFTRTQGGSTIGNTIRVVVGTARCTTGYSGTYPNCVPPNTSCPAGQTGTPPNCVAATCPSGQTGTPPNCVAATCSTGQTGTPPNCSVDCNLTPSDPSCTAAPTVCPTGSVLAGGICVTDACPNIAGVQSSVPSGYFSFGGQCHRPGSIVSFTAQPKTVDLGKSARLSWVTTLMATCQLREVGGSVLSNALNSAGLDVTITHSTDFNLSCVDRLNRSHSATVSVKLNPHFIEPQLR